MKLKKLSGLSDIDNKLPLIEKFVARLKKGIKQDIPIVEVEKTKRTHQGVSAKPVHLGLEKGQTVKLFIRVVDEHADLFAININGKNQPLVGDFSIDYMPAFNKSVDMVANVIRKGQAQFEKKQASTPKKATTSNRTPPKNKVQQLQALREQVQNLDEVIAEKQQIKSKLETELAELTA